MNAADQLEAMAQALQQLRCGSMTAAGFSALAGAQCALLEALPPAFGEVLNGLLTRLESSALFSEESCSFSQTDLLDSLQMWLDKARLRLQAQAAS